MGYYKQAMLKNSEKGEVHMECPQCGKDLIIDRFEDCELVYCSCGYTKMDEPEECQCEECEEELGNNGEPNPVLINDDDWRRDR